jgi:hypothetical protein
MAQISSPNAITAFVQMRLAALEQTPEQVFERKPGDRMLSGPYLAKKEAEADWQFSLLSLAAYGRSEPKRKAIPKGTRQLGTLLQTIIHMWKHKAIAASSVPDRPTSQTPDADAQLTGLGWERWKDFPDQTLEKEMIRSHLRAEVWEHENQKLIVVAFGGTVFTSGEDWKSNLRWFIPWHKDEYTQIVKHFAPDFVEAFGRRRPNESEVSIYSTGHSLGGGLAQQFAYALPTMPSKQKVSKVYAFDPSPVTGFYSVKRRTRKRNRKDLQISRIYERGEILAIVRSFTSLIIKPSSVDPEIRGARFNLFYTENAIAGHSIAELATKMQAAAGVPAWQQPVVQPPTPPP